MPGLIAEQIYELTLEQGISCSLLVIYDNPNNESDSDNIEDWDIRAWITDGFDTKLAELQIAATYKEETVDGKQVIGTFITVSIPESTVSGLPQTSRINSDIPPMIGLNCLAWNMIAVKPTDDNTVIRIISRSPVNVIKKVTLKN